MSSGSIFSRSARRSYDQAPYEPEEVFDAWVSNLEATIDAALHPPRKPLFPNPEPTYAISKPSAPSSGPVASSSRIPPAGDDVFSIQRPALVTRTTSYTEAGSDQEEEWPLPSVLGGHSQQGRADEDNQRRSGAPTELDGEADDDGEDDDEDESSGEDDDDMDDDEDISTSQPPLNRAGASAETAYALSDSSDEEDGVESNEEQLEDGPYYDEEDEDEWDENDEDDPASASAPTEWTGDLPPAQSRRGGELPGFSSASNLESAQESLRAAAGSSGTQLARGMSDIIELGDSDDDEVEEDHAPARETTTANGMDEDDDDEEEEEEEEEEAEEEEEEDEDDDDEDEEVVGDAPTRQSQNPFNPPSQRFPHQTPQLAQPSPAQPDDVGEDEDELDGASSEIERDGDESDERAKDADTSGSDDDITAFFPAAEEKDYFAAERSATPTGEPMDSRDATLSPISASLQNALPPSDNTFVNLDAPQDAAVSQSVSRDESAQGDDSLVSRGLAAFLDQMDAPTEDVARPLAPPQFDPTLFQVEDEAVDLNADQLGRPLQGGQGAVEVVERDGDLMEWTEGEGDQPDSTMALEDLLRADMVDPQVADLFEEAAAVSSARAAVERVDEVISQSEPGPSSAPLPVETTAPPSPLKDRELDLKAQLRQRLLDGKAAAKRKSDPPPPPTSSSWQPSPTRVPGMSGSTLPPSASKPDEFELEHEASIQPHLPHIAKPAVDAFEREHDAAIQPMSALSHPAHHSKSAHIGIGPSPSVQAAPVYHAPTALASTSATVAERTVFDILDSDSDSGSDDEVIPISPPRAKVAVVAEEEDEVDEIDPTREGSLNASGSGTNEQDEIDADDDAVPTDRVTKSAPSWKSPQTTSTPLAAPAASPQAKAVSADEEMIEVVDEDSDEEMEAGSSNESKTPDEGDEEEDQEPETDSAAAKEQREETVRAALEAMNEQARAERPVVVEEDVDELEDDATTEAENASGDAALDEKDEPAHRDVPIDAGASSPLYFPPSSPEDEALPLPSIFTPRRSPTTRDAAFLTSAPAKPATDAPVSLVPAVGPSPSRVLPGVAKPGLWNADTFPPFSSPSKTPPAAKEPISSPPTSKAKSSTPEAELPDPRATPPPTELITPDVPASLDVQPSLIVEAPQTRQATPVPSEQHTYGVDDSEPQPLDLDEEVERILDADEEYASDSIPLEDEPAVIPAYVEPELGPDGALLVEDDFPSGPPSAAFSPVVAPSTLPDPALAPVLTHFAIPPVPRDLSEVATSVASEAPESRAITPSVEGDNADVHTAKLDLGAVDDGKPTVVIPATLADNSESGGSSDGGRDYALDVDASWWGDSAQDSDDNIITTLKPAPAERQPAEASNDIDTADEAQPLEAEAVDALLDESAVISEDEERVPSSDAAEAEAPLLGDLPSAAAQSELGAAISNLSEAKALPSILKPTAQVSPAADAVRPSPLVFADPEPMSPLVGSPAPSDSPSYSPGPSRPMLSSSTSAPPSRSLSYHVHGSSRASTSVVPPLHRSTSASTSSVHDPSGPSSVAPHPTPTRDFPSAVRHTSPAKTHAEPSLPSSPITRSQCVYHLLRIPGPTRYSESIIFVVPFCSLALTEPIEEEHARILGKASDADNEQRKPLVGEGRVVIEEEMEQKLTRICGIDILRGGECFYLRSVPREADDTNDSDSTSDDDQTPPTQPKQSSSKPSSASKPASKGKPSSLGPKRKRAIDADDFDPKAESSEDEDVKSSPTKKRPAKKRESLTPVAKGKGKEKEVAVDEKAEAAEEKTEAEESTNSVKRKRSEEEVLAEKAKNDEDAREAKKVKAVEEPPAPTPRKSLFGRFFGRS